ncbi:hypothetical protein DNHGIG_40840 [Collibacillus ludicampi]|uniref:Uncharacterized protein n=1 Tax=Collibacillus ludicampi TaxID=2771369 RepID=A0AAV4LLX2_9BACL|nr:hypothetical protein [Collibacillus ludicampi]GIM48535.1 hypothetical protein DNHGIG_40840 [Collibacillus ludicampi]
MDERFKGLFEASERWRKMIEPVLKNSETIARVMQPVLRHQELFGRNLQSRLAQVAKQTRHVSDVFKPISGALEKAAGLFNNENIKKAIQETTDDIEKFKLIMLKIGYPAHYEIPIITARKIVRFYKERTLEETKNFVKEFLIKFYDNNKVDRIVQRWKEIKWISPRLRLLNEAVEAHISGKYFLSVSTLIPQFEGIIADYFKHTGFLKQNTLKEYISNLLQDEDTFSMDSTVLYFYLDIVLDDFKHGEPINSQMSRHAILHGYDVDYGTEINSLCSILLIDYLLFKIGSNNLIIADKE